MNGHNDVGVAAVNLFTSIALLRLVVLIKEILLRGWWGRAGGGRETSRPFGAHFTPVLGPGFGPFYQGLYGC